MHLLSIEPADWPKLQDMFWARGAKTWQRQFPVGFPVRICALYLLFIEIFHEGVARIESRCMIAAKHVFLLLCYFVPIVLEKPALALKCSHNFPVWFEQINSLTPGRFKVNFRWVMFKLILVVNGWGISCETALIWVSMDHTYDKSTLVQVMAWCPQATSHYLSQCWPRSMSPYGVTRPQWVNKRRKACFTTESKWPPFWTTHFSGMVPNTPCTGVGLDHLP